MLIKNGLTLFIACCFFVLNTNAADKIAPGKEGVLVLKGDKEKTPSRLYVPSDYNPGKKWPLVISMHGRDGSPTTQPWKGILEGKRYFIAGLNFADFPMRDSGERKGDYPNSIENNKVVREFFLQAINKIAQDYNIDTEHVIYGGNSMGGWMCPPLCFYPGFVDNFRGFVVWGCATAHNDDAKFSVGKGKPIMVFHGENCFNRQRGDQFLPLVEKAGFIVSREIIAGQGHGPSPASSRDVIGGWFASLWNEDQLLKGVCPLEWSTGSLSGNIAGKSPGEISAFIKEQEFYKNRPEDKPSLVWLFSNETVRKKGKPAKLSRSAAKCEKVYDSVFMYPASKKTLPLATSFNCIAVDLTNVSKKDNSVFNSETAPLVVLISKDGNTIDLLKGTISDSSLLGKMSPLLSEDEAKAAQARSKEITKQVNDWKKLQKKFAKGQKKLIASFTGGLKFNNAKIVKQKEELAEILTEYQSILKSMGGEEKNAE